MNTEQLTAAAEWAEQTAEARELVLAMGPSPDVADKWSKDAAHLRILAKAARMLADADVEQVNDTCHRQWSEGNFWIPPHSQVLVVEMPRKDANES